MGRRGPLPKDPALKMLSGKAPITMEAVERVTEPPIPPEIPSHFKGKEIEVWNKTIELLKCVGSLRQVDGAILGAYCSAFVRWQDSEKLIQLAQSTKEGLCMLTMNGDPKGINPLVIISREAQRDMVFYANQLGMTPASRIKMASGIVKIVEENPFTKIRERKNAS